MPNDLGVATVAHELAPLLLLTLVKRDSPAVHMVKRSGIWNMDV